MEPTGPPEGPWWEPWCYRFLRPSIYHSSFSVLTLLFSFHAPWSPVRRQCHIYVKDTHCTDLFLVCIYMAMFRIFISLSKICLDTQSFPLESQYSWNTLHRCVCEVITVSRYSFCESFWQKCEGSLANDSRNSFAIRTFCLLLAPVFVLFSWRGACVHAMNPHRFQHPIPRGSSHEDIWLSAVKFPDTIIIHRGWSERKYYCNYTTWTPKHGRTFIFIHTHTHMHARTHRGTHTNARTLERTHACSHTHTHTLAICCI